MRPIPSPSLDRSSFTEMHYGRYGREWRGREGLIYFFFPFPPPRERKGKEREGGGKGEGEGGENGRGRESIAALVSTVYLMLFLPRYEAYAIP